MSGMTTAQMEEQDNAIGELLRVWRERAADNSNDDLAAGAYETCANELEALLLDTPGSSTEKTL